MRKYAPLKTLCEEAESALGNLSRDSWEGSNGRAERFTFWFTGSDIIAIKIMNGDGLNDTTYYQHFLRLFPTEKKAVFYKFGGLPEKRGLIEQNLLVRGYAIEERDGAWFNQPHMSAV